MNNDNVTLHNVHTSTSLPLLRLPRTAKELYALNDSDPRKQGFIDALNVELQQMHDTHTLEMLLLPNSMHITHYL